MSDFHVCLLDTYSTDECLKSAVLLSDVLADKEWGPSYAPDKTAFNKYSGFPDTYFKYFVRSFEDYVPQCLNSFPKENP
jgi:hypothetical protein